MKILLANPRGFCAGVRMAIRCLEIVLDRLPAPIFVYHEIVHNQHVVRQFEARGAVFVDRLQDVPVGATVVFSAHGVSPVIRQQARARQLRTIDATCPLVAKVHTETVRFAQQGYQIILIGHAGHDEIQGTRGEAPDHITLVECEADVDDLSFSSDVKIAYLTQTTLSVSETQRIIDRLVAKYPAIEGPSKSDICYATHNRQQAVRHLARLADIVLVVGSQNSSNSRRLCEVAIDCGASAHLLDDDQQLTASWFEQDSIVGITAGASAPEVSVQSILSWLRDRYPTSEVTVVGEVEERRSFPLPDSVLRLRNSHPQMRVDKRSPEIRHWR